MTSYNESLVIPESVIAGAPHEKDVICAGLRDGLLNREIFYILQEAQILIERWRNEYNHFRPHSALEYRPPAP